MAVTTTAPPAPTAAAASRRGGAVAVTAVLVLLIAALALADIAQGTSGVGAAEVWKALTGQADAADASVVVASRLPRMTAGILVGAALGMAGAALQAVSRNVIAAPDTLAVNAGSYLALGLAAATGVSLPLLASSGVAFVGGLAAAAVVLGVSGLGGGTVRLVLAGSALTLGLTSVTEGLLLLFPSGRKGCTPGTRAASRRTVSAECCGCCRSPSPDWRGCCWSPAGSTPWPSATTPRGGWAYPYGPPG